MQAKIRNCMFCGVPLGSCKIEDCATCLENATCNSFIRQSSSTCHCCTIIWNLSLILQTSYTQVALTLFNVTPLAFMVTFHDEIALVHKEHIPFVGEKSVPEKFLVASEANAALENQLREIKSIFSKPELCN